VAALPPPRPRGLRLPRWAAAGAVLLLAACMPHEAPPAASATEAVAAAEAAPAGAAGPRLVLEHTSHDFGEVTQGKIVEHRFPFSNGGDAELRITDVSTPCGCTIGMPDKKVLEPGESSYIDVTYDSAARSGDVERVVTILSNDPVHPELTLNLHANVDASMHEAFKSGETLFGEKCGKCHAVPAKDDAGVPRTGQALYDAVCWFCHGKARQGKTAPALGAYADAADPYLRQIISEGRPGTEMPGFAQDQKGPLTPAQIASLLDLLHTEPPEAPPEPEPEPVQENPDAPFFR
jgi:mono/diheme cytochrome c family protein